MRRDLRAQLGVLDALVDVARATLRRGRGDLRLEGEHRHVGLVAPSRGRCGRAAQPRHPPQRGPLEPAVDAVVARDDPRRGALVDVEVAPTTFCSSGTIWIAEAPVPITATRLPARSTSWSQRAEWKTSPWKVSSPSISGSRGSERPPAPTTGSATTQVPFGVRTVQRWASSSQAASSTGVSKTNRSSVPDSVGDLLDVVLDLRLRRVGARPVVAARTSRSRAGSGRRRSRPGRCCRARCRRRRGPSRAPRSRSRRPPGA